MPKNEKLSIRNKYKRRVEALRLTISGYEHVAALRLKRGGKIHDRDNINEILSLTKELRRLLPKRSSNRALKLRVWKNLSELFGMEYQDPPESYFDE